MTARPSRPDRPGPDVSPVEAAAAARADRTLVLLDVREPDEWAAGHAPGAVHMPLGRLRPDQLPPGVPVIAVCRSGNRSGTAAGALAAAGVDVRNMAGGMRLWARQGLPVVRADGSPGTIE
jgi:rhodanese-related sulfurtransferase